MKFKCTFTGVDESTSFTDLESLIAQYPWIEFGVLFSDSRAGLEPRYPSLDFIKRFAAWFYGFYSSRLELQLHGSIALHVCGSAVLDLLNIPDDGALLSQAELKQLIPDFDRVQLNINLTTVNPDKADWMKAAIGWKLEDMGKEYSRPFILQYNANNASMLDFILGYYKNNYIHILKDASGGQGVYSDDFSIPKACDKCAIGFAGGIGVDSVRAALYKAHDSVMAANVEGHNDNKLYWLDMESSVRTDDRFDLGKVRQVATIVHQTLGQLL